MTDLVHFLPGTPLTGPQKLAHVQQVSSLLPAPLELPRLLASLLQCGGLGTRVLTTEFPHQPFLYRVLLISVTSLSPHKEGQRTEWTTYNS